MSNKKGNPSNNRNRSIQKDSGRGLPVTSTSTPMPPTKPPANEDSGAPKKGK